ncbi:dihydrolipoamide acetyltransferase family protein [Zhihengliuella flava]|uniref:Dihydrolipoamide acetyltransferase component of pyruvate dehydrogenase complex n=1 Tax=Zhihengliuella flava TaxID=1285193 RepID=A0A931DAB7_9MICC|nr:dihydrolipoamide acetyltransferase family protein [Zhihengliuella flava]MBG6083851.1 pyruvate dehydrogenase E2 component (dihydrolipoamide acetyltransferase) [Zhihengliuella flava]
MQKVFNLPDLGEGLTESEVVAWKVTEGETVSLNQVIADVETAKALVELPSPYSGVVTRIFAEPGAIVEVGQPLLAFEVDQPAGSGAQDGGSSADAASESAAEQVTTPAREPNLVGYGAAVETGRRPQRRRRVAVPAGGSGSEADAGTAAPPAVDTQASNAVAHPAERPRSTPPVRKLAKDLGVCLDELTGSGPQGLITRADVESAGQHGSAAAEGAAPQSEARDDGTRCERVRISSVQRAMARAMSDSVYTAPHATEFLTVDVTESMRLLERLRAAQQPGQAKLTPLTLVAKAVCLQLARVPELNSAWDEEAGDIIRFHDVNLGIAAATERGLLVPNIKAAQSLDLAALAEATAALVDRARTSKTRQDELRGGTFSITNIGVFGIDAGTPILNPGEAGILGLGQVRVQPWEYQGEVALREVMTLSLSFDHRLVDGAQASRFLAGTAGILRDPASLITLV